ncbi:MAG: hypothetical protein ACR2QF_09130, partial [Geminicoccaceae bacterium]
TAATNFVQDVTKSMLDGNPNKPIAAFSYLNMKHGESVATAVNILGQTLADIVPDEDLRGAFAEQATIELNQIVHSPR